jgi:hypothetical protein
MTRDDFPIGSRWTYRNVTQDSCLPQDGAACTIGDILGMNTTNRVPVLFDDPAFRSVHVSGMWACDKEYLEPNPT